ncbi:ESPR domain-containing protein [Edwardsiella anguillarum]|uniref:ESPR domain-containing protein n=2 Tax=Edwardsiella anguillarum TaxID=1821960 RepID=UPI0008FF9A4D|nr:hypothetical protein CGL57_08355 [Edwardsiella anguillarum]
MKQMNKIYSVIWNHAIMEWTVASELGRGRKKVHPPGRDLKSKVMFIWLPWHYLLWPGIRMHSTLMAILISILQQQFQTACSGILRQRYRLMPEQMSLFQIR